MRGLTLVNQSRKQMKAYKVPDDFDGGKVLGILTVADWEEVDGMLKSAGAVRVELDDPAESQGTVYFLRDGES